MSRPRRSEQATRQFSMYLTPTALESLRAAAAEARLSPGAYIEALIGFDAEVRQVNVSVDFTGPLSKRKHVKTDHPTFGKVCSVCKMSRRQMELHANCPGPKEES